MFNRKLILNLSILLAYTGMIAANYLANAWPINGLTTGAVSAAYPNLFAPAGATFSIWGLIYLLLGIFVLAHLGKASRLGPEEVLRQISWLFVLTCLLNAAWIFAWHYRLILLSVGLMLALLLSLIRINTALRRPAAGGAPPPTSWLVRLPFSIYFGWITVATIANITVLLVSVGWNRCGLSEVVWTVVIILVGAAIGMATMWRNRDIAYGLTIVWAYGGIILKHSGEAGFAGAYPAVILAAAVAIAGILGTAAALLGRRLKLKKNDGV